MVGAANATETVATLRCRELRAARAEVSETQRDWRGCTSAAQFSAAMPGRSSCAYLFDARAVRASRVLLGLLLLQQTVYFTAHRDVWLSEHGVALFYMWHASHEPNPWLISPHALLPLLTLIHGCALALVVGYRPRLAALVGGWLFSGLAPRTTAVTAGDEALRSLLSVRGRTGQEHCRGFFAVDPRGVAGLPRAPAPRLREAKIGST